jgi:hypothetical protein
VKILLTLLSLSAFLSAEYQQGKIDMHGGNNYSNYKSSTKSFETMQMGMSAFLDTNSSKKETKKKERK